MKNRNWYLVESKKGDEYISKLSATDMFTAIIDASAEWLNLSQFDKKCRDEFYIIRTVEDEDGVINYDEADKEINLINKDIVDKAYEDPEGVWTIKDVDGIYVTITDESGEKDMTVDLVEANFYLNLYPKMR